MKHKVFTRGMRILIVGTLIIMALHLSDWILIGYTAVCLAVMTVSLIVNSARTAKQTDDPIEEPPEEDRPEQEDKPKEPTEEEIDTWYQMIGKTILTDAITDLNTRGYKQLTINENGEILISDTVCDIVDSFPKRPLWQRLTELLKDDGLNAFVNADEISVSW